MFEEVEPPPFGFFANKASAAAPRINGNIIFGDLFEELSLFD